MDLKETELCLGLPGGGGGGGELIRDNNNNNKVNGKRGFSETVDLKLNFHQASDDISCAMENNKMKSSVTTTKEVVCNKDPIKPPAK